ncbi:Auxin-responsive protein IAA20 isoform 2 [Zea mays]|uniref:Auxin-responsive protein n=1 Tax=Zea mays TaxID=4577 RepID=A0A804PUF9_MAIZE|nr:Auxin-responsive protein IAA20 isoform 2 [Zea mays]ONM62901.1 Auxin-responsive protein IAA29 [Zea mays]|eukprot:XP_008647869.1 uncharacterized protein LOC100282670 isoform X1 [Zea mays]
MELELGLAPPNPHQPLAAAAEFVGLLSSSAGSCGNKRVLGDAFGAAKAATLPLFVCEDGDGGGGDRDRDGVVDHEQQSNNVPRKKRLVGWPPVKCARRRSCGGGYVKVKLEGVPIGRKVDVSIHGSYQELLRTLESMFPSGNQQDHAEDEVVVSHERRRRHPYVVTYEDGEGDWLLVGDDVPWEVFVKSVKRLKILA